MHTMEYGCGTGLLSFMLRPRLGQDMAPSCPAPAAVPE
jgi:hypothetical protein